MNSTTKLLLSISTLLLVSCGTAFSSNSPYSFKLASNAVESIFSVMNGKITAEKSDLQTCKTDNEYMLSALKERQIHLTGVDYRTEVSSKVYKFNKADSPDLKLIHYAISILTQKGKVTRITKNIPADAYVKSYIPISKAPTSCYIFSRKNNTLHLLCHYGMKVNRNITDVIQSLK